jgi:hypothetical protein
MGPSQIPKEFFNENRVMEEEEKIPSESSNIAV